VEHALLGLRCSAYGQFNGGGATIPVIARDAGRCEIMKLPLSYLWVPARISSKQLVVVLHGQGGSSADLQPLQSDLGIVEFNYLLLDALDPYHTGFRWFNWEGNPLADVRRSCNLLAEVFTATAQAGYAPDRTFLLGFSQGCLMTLEFGARHSRRLAGYIGISGFILDPAALLRDLNPEVNSGDWLVTHGTADEAVPVEKTRAQIQMLRDGGFKIDYREYAKAHNIDEHRELPELREWMMARVTLKMG
jgi:phospholipase/carboxylesterase